MSSKVDYLKRYSEKKVKKKRKVKKSNLSVVDDDINWVKTIATNEIESGDSDDAPLIAEVRDETVVKWQPLSSAVQENLEDLSPPRKVLCHNDESFSSSKVLINDLSPPRRHKEDVKSPRQLSSTAQVLIDVSPPRRYVKNPPTIIQNYSSPSRKGAEDVHTDQRLSKAYDQKAAINEPDLSEEFTKTVYRERFGMLHNKTKEEEDYQREKDAEFAQWGRG